jgi:hypothetical protein
LFALLSSLSLKPLTQQTLDPLSVGWIHFQVSLELEPAFLASQVASPLLATAQLATSCTLGLRFTLILSQVIHLQQNWPRAPH